MAYNPFNIFRRNQKTIFAVITVFIMFTFVLSSGVTGGDFFDWLPRWLGSTRQKGEVVATLDGSAIYERDLTGDRNSLKLQRVMANRFMAECAKLAVNGLDEQVASKLGRMSPEGQQMMQPIRQQQMFIQQIARQIRDPRMLADFARQAEAEIRPRLYAMVSAPNLRSEDKEVARAMLASMAIQQGMGGPEHYFGNAPNNGNRDLIHFLLWQKKADQLGIRFTTEDVKLLVQGEFSGALASDVPAQRALRESMPGFNMDACLKAIGEEFRVRAAQAAVLGPAFSHRDRAGVDKTYSGSPPFPVPYEAYEFFREEVSPTTFAAVPVPAANFVAQVPDPDESDPKVREELRALYRQHSNDEPNPGRETPGFKTPRRVTVGWLAIRGDEPYYLALAEERLRRGEPVARAGLFLAPRVFDLSPAEAAAAAAPVAATDALLEAAYKAVENRHAADLGLRWGRAGARSEFEPLEFLLDTSVVRPGVPAAAAGAAAGNLLALGNPLSAVAAAAAAPVGYEARDRLRAGLPLALGAVPGPGMFGTLMAGEVGYLSAEPKPLPLSAHRPTLMKDLVAETARRAAADDAEAFVRETRRWSGDGKARDKWWARQYVQQFAAKRGLTVHATTEPRTEWTLEEDPVLDPLVKAQRESLKAASGPHGMAGQRGYVPFGDRFFYDAGRSGKVPAVGTFAAGYYPEERPAPRSVFDPQDKPQYLVWRTTEEAAKSRAFEAAKADVVLAWKRQKARQLAKARAEQLAEAVRKADAASGEVLVPQLRDLVGRLQAEFADEKARDRVDAFLVRGVAPLTAVPDPTAGKGLSEAVVPTPRGAVQPFGLPASENLRYPTPEMRQTLLADRAKGPKHVTVLADVPKDTYYVFVPVKRELKTESDYRFEVVGEAAQRFGGGTVQGEFRRQAEDKALRSVLGLLKQEFKYSETEEQKKRLDESEKRGLD